MLLVLSSSVVGGISFGDPGGSAATPAGLVVALAALVAMGFVTVLLVRLGATTASRPQARPELRDDPAALGPIPPPRARVASWSGPRSEPPGIRVRRPAGRPDPVGKPLPTALEWRFGQFLDLGFELDGALELAQQDIDVHMVRRLVYQGCPPALAARIGAPIVPVGLAAGESPRCAS